MHFNLKSYRKGDKCDNPHPAIMNSRAKQKPLNNENNLLQLQVRLKIAN
jgi:hypothetical protein